MSYKCLIVDDEPPAIKVLERYISSLPQFENLRPCKNAFEAFNVLSKQKIDLIFLDVQMPQLIGTDLLRALSYPPKAIFTTAHKDFAIDAFELDAIDYLLKPISFERFLKAVNKFCHITNYKMESFDENVGFLYFRFDRKMVKVFLNDIKYIESFKDYMVIHREHEPELRIRQSLNSVETMLPQHQFIRIHRSFIVAVNKITAFTKNDVEIGKIELPIGKSYTDVFRKLKVNNLNLSEEIEED